jgi:hypothetical protein
VTGRKLTSGAEFDDFLYAPIVEESNGTVLTVLSALARVNLNPWEEAARLALLPCETATTALGKLILALPNGLPQGLDARALARQLIGRLPRHAAARAVVTAPVSIGGFAIDPRVVSILVLIYFALSLAFLGAHWLEGSADASAMKSTAAAPPQAPAPPVASSHPD